MSGKIQIEGGDYQNFEGAALADGYLIVQLSHDGQEAVDPGIITGAPKIKISLDNTGNIPASPATMIWPNDQISPGGTFYTVLGYAADGTQVFGPQTWNLTSAVSPYNVANQVPSFPPGNGLGGTSTTGPVLETNGTVNTNQALLNIAGSGSIVVANSAGTTTISGGAASFTTAGQGYFFGPGITVPIQAISRGSGASWAPAVNVVNVVQFELMATFQVTKISINVLANSIGDHASFGIYTANGNTKLVDSGTFSLSANGVLTNSITSVSLSPGVYFWAQTSTTTTCTLATTSSLALNDAKVMNANASFPRIATAANASSGGVLPSTLGALTAVTNVTIFDSALVMLEP